jgi:hypothetical protein
VEGARVWTIEEYIDGRWVRIKTFDTEEEVDKQLARLRRLNPRVHYRKKRRSSAFSWWWS